MDLSVHPSPWPRQASLACSAARLPYRPGPRDHFPWRTVADRQEIRSVTSEENKDERHDQQDDLRNRDVAVYQLSAIARVADRATSLPTGNRFSKGAAIAPP